MDETSPYASGKTRTDVTAELPDGSARCGIVRKVTVVHEGIDGGSTVIEVQCSAAATVLMTYGCVHEHIVDVNACAACREEVLVCLGDPGVLCVLCEEAGCLLCLVGGLGEETIPVPGQLVQ